LSQTQNKYDTVEMEYDKEMIEVVNKKNNKRKGSNGNKQNLNAKKNLLNNQTTSNNTNSTNASNNSKLKNNAVKNKPVQKNIPEKTDLINVSNSPGSSNRFEIFNNIKLQSTQISSVEETNSSVSDNNTPQNSVVRSQQETSKQNVQKATSQNNQDAKFCPPIILYKTNIQDILESLGKDLNINDYKIINVNRNKSKLYVKDPAIQDLIMNKIRESDGDVEAHTHTDISQREVNLILRGIHFTCDENIILEQLQEQCKNTIIRKVSRFYTAKSVKNKIQYNLFLVQLEPGQSPDEVMSVKYLLNQSAKWEKPKKLGVIQCKRCQSYGHVAKKCAHHYRCVKCPGEHGPYECTFEKTENIITPEGEVIEASLPYCCNCKENGHPANYRGCPKYLEYKNRLLGENASPNKTQEVHKTVVSQNKAQQSRKTIPKVNQKHSTVKASQSFANVTKGLLEETQHLNLNDNHGIFRQFKELSQQLFKVDFNTLTSKIQHFMENYKTKSPMQQKSDYLDILDELFIHGL
jgi:hypothetical protein